jgi:hypothetical protein
MESNRHDERHALDAGDRRKVADEIIIEVAVERRIDRRRRAGQQQRVAVRRRMRDREALVPRLCSAESRRSS